MTQDSRLHSIDGSSFQFTTALGEGLDLGGYVRIDTDDGASFLGQILDTGVSEADSGRIEITG